MRSSHLTAAATKKMRAKYTEAARYMRDQLLYQDSFDFGYATGYNGLNYRENVNLANDGPSFRRGMWHGKQQAKTEYRRAASGSQA